MNIGIFETQHFEGAYPMIRIMDVPGNHLTIFANEDTYQRFTDLFGKDMQRYTWVIKPAGMHNRSFVWQIYKTCKKNNIRLLFLNTVAANFMLYGWAAAFLPHTKVILTLHDANNFLQSQYSFNPRKSIRHIGKQLLARFCYAYSTVSETVQAHLKKSMGIQKKVFCIPGAVFERQHNGFQIYDIATPLRIVVPGSIDNKRRDYSKVFDLLDKIKEYALPVTIVLAGGPYGMYGQTMLNQFRAYRQEQQNLVYFESPLLDQPVFDAILDSAHFVWIPSVIKTVIADNIEEEYGLTKSSGNIFDAIKHAKPLLVPQKLTMPAALHSSVVAYDSIESLVVFLITIIKLPANYNSLAAEAFNNSMAYTAEKMRERVKELF